MSPSTDRRGYLLLSSPSGVDDEYAVNRLISSLDHMGQTVGEPINIEHILREKAERELDSFFPPGPVASVYKMKHVTRHLPRDILRDLWKESIDQMFEVLGETDNGVITPVICNLIYFSSRRKEFFSVIDEERFGSEAFEPHKVVVLIDDIYDMYYRLTGNDEVFDLNAELRRVANDTRDEEGTEDFDSIPEQERAYLYTQFQVGVLDDILSWRYHEMILAEKLASRFDCPFAVLAAKQSPETLARFWASDSPNMAYLSHPISGPRRNSREGKPDPEFTRQVNALQTSFLTLGINIVMPTAIDEYRIHDEKLDSSTESVLSKYLPKLSRRWPLPDGPLMYETPEEASDPHHLDFFAPKAWEMDPYLLSSVEPSEDLSVRIDVLLRYLNGSIEFHVAARDHLIVSSSNSLILFRPFYERGKRFSGGVGAELLYAAVLLNSDPEKRLAFVHFKEDVDRRLEANEDMKESEVRNIVQEFIVTDRGKRENEAKKLLRNVEEGGGSGSGGPFEDELDYSDIRWLDEEKESLYERADQEWKDRLLIGYQKLHSELTEQVDIRDQVKYWVFDDQDELLAQAEDIAEFLT